MILNDLAGLLDDATAEVGHPGRIRARLRLGDLLESVGRDDEARRLWREARDEAESGTIELPDGLREQVAERLAGAPASS